MTRQEIDNLIIHVRTTDDPASVTNEQVGAVLDHLNRSDKEVVDAVSDAMDAVTTEASTRAGADEALRTAINNEASERAGADEALRTAINNEASLRATEDQSLRDDMGEALAAESSQRENADIALDGRIDEIADMVGEPGGIAPLDADGKLPYANMSGDAVKSISAISVISMGEIDTPATTDILTGRILRVKGSNDAYTAGWLLYLNCHNYIKQILITHHRINDGGSLITDTHDEQGYNVYKRICPVSNNTPGEWTAWVPVGGDEIFEAISREASLRSEADTELQMAIDALRQAVGEGEGNLSSRLATAEGNISDIQQAISDGVGTVKGITLNGQSQQPDIDGVVHLTVDEAQSTDSVDINSTLPVQSAAVAAKFAEIEEKTLANVEVDEGDDTVTLRLLNKRGGEIASAEIPAVGGGGAGAPGEYTRIQLSASVDNPVIKEGGSVMLTYTYNAIDTEGNNANVRATIDIEVKRGSITVMSKSIPDVGRGTYELDLTGILSPGNHDVNVRATIQDPASGTTRRKPAYTSVYVSALTLTSDFSLSEMAKDGAGLSGASVKIPYTVSGAGRKTVKLYVDSVQQQTQEQSLSGARPGEFVLPLTSMTPGRHTVQLVAEATIDGIPLTSDSVFIDIVKAGLSGAFTAIMFSRPDGHIFASADQPTVLGGQYEPIEVKYIAYDPENETASVDISVDGVKMQTMSVPRQMQRYVTRFADMGIHEISFAVNGLSSGFARRRMSADIAETRLGISIAQAGLVQQFTAAGRSNSEDNPAVWANQSDPGSQNVATFQGVDFSSSGWTGDSLRLINGAKLTLDTKPFATDVKGTGLTLEMIVKVDNVSDPEATLVSCVNAGKGFSITPDTISYLTGQTVQYTDENGNTGTRAVGLSTKYASGQWMRVAFAISRASDDRLMEMYMDGGRRAADIYDSNFSFRQDSPQPITFDSEGADLEIRRIRIYNRALSDDELLENAIVEADTSAEMMAMKQENDVLDGETGDIDIDKCMQRGEGVIRIVRQGRLEDVYETNNKKTDFLADVYYWPSAAAKAKGAKTFVLHNCNIRIQGTSSTKYPSKNIRIYCNRGNDQLEMIIDGQTAAVRKYALRDGVAAQEVLCAKSDYSDSSMSLNTGGAKLFNDCLKELNLLTPPQLWQKEHGGEITARAAIDGWPVSIFGADSLEGANTYYGQYNLNNEKSQSGEVFGMEGIDGFTPGCPIALESLNNNEPAALFQSQGDVSTYLAQHFDDGMEVNYTNHGGDGDVKWATLTDGEQQSLTRLYTFIQQCKPAAADLGDDPAAPIDIESWQSETFRMQADRYFDIDYLLTYYLWTDYFLAVDQRAKNILWRTWDGLTWYPTYYDGDTQMGKRNDSFLVYGYGTDLNTWDAQAGKLAFEGRSSWLWLLCLANFSDRIAQCAERLRGVLSTSRVLNMYLTEQMGAWSEREFNKSGHLKYIYPALHAIYGEHTWPFIYALQGSNKNHREYMVRNRFALLDAKYACGDFRNDNIDLYLAQGAAGLSTFIMYPSETYAFAYGTNNHPYIGTTGVVQKEQQAMLGITGAYTINDPLRIYGASRMIRLDAKGACSTFKNGLILDKCASLRELDLSVPSGSQPSTNWFFTIGGCRQLRSVNLRGQTEARTSSATSSTIDLSVASRLEQLDARDTSAEYIIFAPGAPVTDAKLPATLVALTLDHLPLITNAGLSLQGWANMREVSVSGCPNLDSKTIVNQWIGNKAADDTLCSLTLTDISWRSVTVTELLRIAQIGTLDLSGTIELTEAPTPAQAQQLVNSFGRSCFGGSGRLTITVPGCDFIIAAPSYVYEGADADSAAVIPVISVTPGMTGVQISVECPDNVSYRIDGDTVKVWSAETGSARSVTIRASGTLNGVTLRASADMEVRAKVYPTSFSLSAAPTMNSGNTLRVTLTHVAVAGDCGEWTVDWSLSGALADDDNVYIQSSTREGCSIAAQAECPIGTVTVTATVRKGNSALLATVTKDVMVLSGDVIASNATNPALMQVARAKGWTDNDYLTAGQAAAVTDSTFGTATFHQSSISSFDEFAYFNGLRTLPAATFRETSALRELTLLEGLTAIGDYGLWDNKALEILTFPSTLTNVGNQNVNLNHKLHTVYFTGAVPSGSINWANNGVLATHDKVIYVPAGLGAAYRSAWTSLGGWTITEII